MSTLTGTNHYLPLSKLTFHYQTLLAIPRHTWLPKVTSNCNKTSTHYPPTIYGVNFKLYYYYLGEGWGGWVVRLTKYSWTCLLAKII